MTDLERYIVARWAYSVNQPIMSDAEYNILEAAMKQKYPASPYCKQSWSSDPCPVGILKKYNREDLIRAVVLSDKTESIPSLNSLIEVRSEYVNMHTPHRLSFKLDGWNIQASYYNGALIHVQTRGRSTDAVDANVLKPKFPQSIPIKGRVLVTSELIVPNADFQWFKDKYGCVSQRGSCSTALAKGGEALEHVKVLAHGIRAPQKVDPHKKLTLLKNFGFEVPLSTIVESYDQLMEQVDRMSEMKESYPYPTDGLVCEGDLHVRAIRIKGWEEPIYRSYVMGYDEHYGPHSISIQLNIFPIKLPNSTQRNIPATNIARIMSLGLMPGAPIAFRIASSSIADLDEESTRALHTQWRGRYPEYKFMVETNESLK